MSLSRTWSSGSASRGTVPWSLTFGSPPSHRCGKSLHRERCGTEPYLTGQLRCFDGDIDGKRGLLLAVVESDDPRYAMPSRFQILSYEFQLVATHGDGPTTPSTSGRGIRAPPPTPGSSSRRASLLWASFGWSDFPGFLEGYSCLGLRAGLADFGLLAGWGLFFPTLSWPLVAAGMMMSVGLAGGVVAVSAITSSPTLVIFNGVRESRLSPSELELSLDSHLFPRLRGMINSDPRSFGASVELWGVGVAARFYRLSPQ